jgi:hypothetical protein
MSQKPNEARASLADTPDNLFPDWRAPGQPETGASGRETTPERAQRDERAQQAMPAPALLGPAGCLGVLSGTARLSELPCPPEDSAADH